MDEPYSNIQRGIIRPLLASLGILFLALAFFGPENLFPVFFGTALLLYACSFMFGYLATEDKGEFLLVRFGPLPFFRRKLRYADIVSVEQRKGGFLIDGWGGIHWSPSGWAWTVGGKKRVRVVLKRGALIIGTDDPEGLEELLKSKLPKDASRQASGAAQG